MTIARRVRLDLNTAAELRIRDAIGAVESLGAHPDLTEVVVGLGRMLERLADYLEAVECSEPWCKGAVGLACTSPSGDPRSFHAVRLRAQRAPGGAAPPLTPRRVTCDKKVDGPMAPYMVCNLDVGHAPTEDCPAPTPPLTCETCEHGSGYVRHVGMNNDEVVEDCPDCPARDEDGDYEELKNPPRTAPKYVWTAVDGPIDCEEEEQDTNPGGVWLGNTEDNQVFILPEDVPKVIAALSAHVKPAPTEGTGKPSPSPPGADEGPRVPPEKGDVYSNGGTFEWTFNGRQSDDGSYISHSNLGTEVHWMPASLATLRLVRRGASPDTGER